MKKIVFTILAIVWTLSINAQFVVGGSLGYSTDRTTGWIQYGTNSTSTISNSNALTSSSFSVIPKFGYQVNETVQIGLSFGLSSYTRKVQIYNKTDYVKATATQFEIIPYCRFNIIEEFGNLKMFFEANIPISTQSPQKMKSLSSGTLVEVNDWTRITSWGCRITPGFNYTISDNLNLDLYINVAQLYFAHTTTRKDDKSNPNYTDIDVTNDNSWGIGINTYDPAVRFGVNFTF